MEGFPDFGEDVFELFFLLRSGVKEMSDGRVFEPKFEESHGFFFVGNQVDNVVLVVVHLFSVVLGVLGIEHCIVIERFNVSK